MIRNIYLYLLHAYTVAYLRKVPNPLCIESPGDTKSLPICQFVLFYDDYFQSADPYECPKHLRIPVFFFNFSENGLLKILRRNVKARRADLKGFSPGKIFFF